MATAAGVTGWELALVTTTSSNDSALSQSKLVFLLSLYHSPSYNTQNITLSCLFLSVNWSHGLCYAPMDTDRSSSIHLLKSFQRNSNILEGKHECNMTWNSTNSLDAWDAELIQQIPATMPLFRIKFLQSSHPPKLSLQKIKYNSVIPYCFMTQLFFTHSCVL